jgi:hypothetical protein
MEACWDAANEPCSALARQLGFQSTGKYEAYRRNSRYEFHLSRVSGFKRENRE